MKKRFLFLIIIDFAINILFAQGKQHKIVFDFTRADTSSFSVMVKHVRNIMQATDAKLEVVCFGPGLDLLLKDKTTVQKEIEELTTVYHVVFVACEETMKRRGISKSQLLPNMIMVPAGILELSAKQMEGWSYIKEGY